MQTIKSAIEDLIVPSKEVPVLIGLGSNVGDCLQNMVDAIKLLQDHMDVVATSRVYRTAPMYVEDQPDFFNAALIAQTTLSPRALLAKLKEAECQVGRCAREINGPREIDLDLLAYGSLSYKFEKKGQRTLVVPHPKTPERRFVLQPLADIASEFILPNLGRVDKLLAKTNGQADSVQVIEDAILPLCCH